MGAICCRPDFLIANDDSHHEEELIRFFMIGMGGAGKSTNYSRGDTLPTEEDIVHARDPTSGLNYYHFRVHKMRIEIHDMGGQMVERVCMILTHNPLYFRKKSTKDTLTSAFSTSYPIK
uniref:Uncharacterized protein n=1 Tax=Parascaris equorum TaxID=6256 RepID=A0A914RGG4_PAREQ